MSFHVSLTPSLEDFVRVKVAQGEYDSASDVLRDALRLLMRREELWKGAVQEKIEEGMASLRNGRAIPVEGGLDEVGKDGGRDRKAAGRLLKNERLPVA